MQSRKARLLLVLRLLLIAVCYLLFHLLMQIVNRQISPESESFEYTWTTAWLHGATALLSCIMVVTILGWSRNAIVTGGVTGIVSGFLITQPMKAFSSIGASRFFSCLLLVLAFCFMLRHARRLVCRYKQKPDLSKRASAKFGDVIK